MTRQAWRLPLLLAVLFGINAFLWWLAQRTPWWSYALFTSAGLILSQTDKDIVAWWRKRRRGRRTAGTA